MLIGKVVRVLDNLSGTSFRVVYGFAPENSNNGEYSFNFGKIKFASKVNKDSEEYNPMAYTYIYRGHKVVQDGVIILNSVNTIPSESRERYLLVVIPRATKIVTDCKKIAGQTDKEAVLEMYPDETIELFNSINEKETYIAVQGENELFLVKKNR